MKLLKLAVLTMVLGFFVISCGNNNNENVNGTDSTTNMVTDTSGSAMGASAIPDTSQHPTDNANTNSATNGGNTGTSATSMRAGDTGMGGSNDH